MSQSVTVIIPAYNAERFIADALDSVGAQTLPPAECIVVDDGSTDATATIARTHSHCTACVSGPNRGVSEARNLGAARARGTHLAFLDADDAWLPERLERMLGRLERESAQAVVCATLNADERLRPQSVLRMPHQLSPERMLLGDVSLVSISSNLLIERDAFAAIGGFDKTVSTSADWQLLFKVVERLRWAYEPTPLVLYRQHASGMSRDVDLMAREILSIYEGIFKAADEHRLAIRRRAFSVLHRTLAGSYFVAGEYRKFARHAVKSLVLNPAQAAYFGAAGLRQVRRRSAKAG